MIQTGITVVVADGQPVVRQGLRSLLASSPDLTVVADAASAEEAVRQTVLHKPRVLVIDVDAPGFRPGETVRGLGRAAPDTSVLVFTARDDVESLVDCLVAGVRGYVLKTGTGEGLVGAIQGVARGSLVLCPGVADRLVGRLAAAPVEPEPFPELTGREREVLELIEAGLRNSAIAARLQLAPKTVSNHISAILAKLHVGSRHEAIELAQRYRPAASRTAGPRLELVGRSLGAVSRGGYDDGPTRTASGAAAACLAYS